MAFELHLGDCLEVMKTMESASVDAVVTDPPAGIGFMGKEWDGSKGGRDSWIAWLAEIMTEAIRIAKPGSYALVWAIPRTSHWTATAMEDAGWEVCDRIAHIFGSGFPKHKSKLKPAIEDWWLCRKPAKTATMLNIDACRVSHNEPIKVIKAQATGNLVYKQAGRRGDTTELKAEGRWPSHLILDDHAAEELDRQSGSDCGGGFGRAGGKVSHATFGGIKNRGNAFGYGDTGGASRFFTRLPIEADDFVPFKYQAKASKADRNEGLEGMAYKTTDDGRAKPIDNAHLRGKTLRQNHHPTVKSTPLMSWLCRLITPTGGTILDPFAGSGSTLKAAIVEGFHCVGIERDPAYHAIANARLEHASPILPRSDDDFALK